MSVMPEVDPNILEDEKPLPPGEEISEDGEVLSDDNDLDDEDNDEDDENLEG